MELEKPGGIEVGHAVAVAHEETFAAEVRRDPLDAAARSGLLARVDERNAATVSSSPRSPYVTSLGPSSRTVKSWLIAR